MAILTTATTNFDKTVVAYVNKRLEEEIRAPLPHLLPGNFVPARFVAGTNNTMRYLRAADFAVTTGTPSDGTPPWLTEGTTPTAEEMGFGYEEFSANQAGRFWNFSDRAMAQSPLDLIAEGADRVARNAVATADQRVADVLIAGSNVMYAGSVSGRTAIAPTNILTGAIVKEAVARLKETNVPTFSDGTFRAICRPSSTFQLESDTAVGGWIDAQRYAGATQLFTGEIGRYAGVRFIESSAAGQVAASSTVGAGIATVALTNPSAASDDIIDTAAVHNLTPGMKFIFTSITGGTGAAANTVYYVLGNASFGAQTFQFSATKGGTAVNFTSDITAGNIRQVVDVNSTFLFGPQAYAFGDWGEIETYITPPGGKGDELHQRASVGWKGYFGARLLEAAGARYVRIEAANNIYPAI